MLALKITFKEHPKLTCTLTETLLIFCSSPIEVLSMSLKHAAVYYELYTYIVYYQDVTFNNENEK